MWALWAQLSDSTLRGYFWPPPPQKKNNNNNNKKKKKKNLHSKPVKFNDAYFLYMKTRLLSNLFWMRSGKSQLCQKSPVPSYTSLYWQLVFYQWTDDPACNAFRSVILGITMAYMNGSPSAYWENKSQLLVYLLRSKLRKQSVFSSSSIIHIRSFFQDLSKSCQSRVSLPLNVYFQSWFIFLVQFSWEHFF